jgi:hypothetical protein
VVLTEHATLLARCLVLVLLISWTAVDALVSEAQNDRSQVVCCLGMQKTRTRLKGLFNLSRRDDRTQPGVLTLGQRTKPARPQREVETVFPSEI